MPILFFATLLQVAAPQAPQATRLEVTPTEASVQVGQTTRLSARAFDAQGREVPSAKISWVAGSFEGQVDSAGLVQTSFAGTIRVTATTPRATGSPLVAIATVTILPAPPARITIDPVPAKLVAGTQLSISATAFSKDNDIRYDPVAFTSSNPAVLRVTSGGLLRAVAPGTATLIATSGPARTVQAVQVLPSAGVRLTLAPESKSVRTGDVIPFTAALKDAAGGAVTGVTLAWSVSTSGGIATIGNDGHFVAETPGRYMITASTGGQTATAVVDATLRQPGRGFQVLGRVPLNFSTAEVWVHPNGQCLYLSTIADRVYSVDVSNPSAPRIVDSMMTNARIVNDVMTTEDGKYGVFSREGASDRKNGIVVFDASNPCHPKPISEFTETVTGGVHSSYVYQGHVYLTDDATGSLRVIDIRNPTVPREVARWQTGQAEVGRYVHDVMVADGLAYLAYWNDGLIILDVGKGIKGGSPEKPVLVSQFKYDLSKLYSRVEQFFTLGFRGTHTAWRHNNYVFIADEVYTAKPIDGLQDGNNLTFGRLQVIDVSNIEKPKLVAWYEPPDGGVHNVWVEGDTLYLGNYQGGARALDISGELKGDLLRQGREIAWLLTADSLGNRKRATFTWGAVVKNNVIYANDINTGLWILKLAPKKPEPVVP